MQPVMIQRHLDCSRSRVVQAVLLNGIGVIKNEHRKDCLSNCKKNVHGPIIEQTKRIVHRLIRKSFLSR